MCGNDGIVGAMPLQKTFKATDRETWRTWLASNHASETVVWVLFQKKHTGESCMSYDDSVEEALCFGWIDSIIKRIDDKTYARKFTPRIDSANWSELNKRRVAKCIQEGRMTEIGLAKVTYADPGNYKASRPGGKTQRQPLSVPAFMSKGLRANEKAWKNFSTMPPSHQRNYILWISSAKLEETRERRLKEAIRMLNNNKQLGLK
jgi:uncharacterized protein YdeI (YjbR/CyaY-like superfamily)